MINYITEFIAFVWSIIMDNIFYINMIFAILIVFFQRRDPKAVWTWLLVLYFIPILGFLLYLVLGQNYHKMKMFKLKEIKDELNFIIRKQEDKIYKREFEFDEPHLDEYSDLVLYNLEASSAIYEEGNEVEIFIDGNDKFSALINDLEEAKSFIHMQYYIIKDDELFDRISEVLIRKANEGVVIRLLYDGIGGRYLKKKTIKKLTDANIKTAVFFPAFLGKFQMRMNYRNHRKLVIIDGKRGYIGGFNIGREYLGLDKKFGNWRDTHLLIKGPAVKSLALRFILDWNYASKENLFVDKDLTRFESNYEPGDVAMQIVSSGPDSKRTEIRDNYIKLISKAKNSIYIQTPYFIPDEATLQSLTIAALSGVEVKVMIPCKPDHPFVYWATHSFAGEILASGARVYKYNDGFLHAKGIMVDGKVSSYGTANLDMRSFLLNFEVNAVIYDSKITSDLERIFMEDLKKCIEITPLSYSQRGIVIRFKEQISRLLAPLL